MTHRWNDLLADAAEAVRRSGERAVENVGFASASDTLELRVFFEDGGMYGEFFDTSVSPCWDGCNNITRTHRSGWCKVNAEHADFDCMCGVDIAAEDEFWASLDGRDRDDGDPMFEVVGSFIFDPNDEEPF